MSRQGPRDQEVTNGAAHVINTAPLSVNGTKEIVTLTGGEYLQHAVTAGSTYIVDSESVDVYVHGTGTAEIYGMVVGATEVLSDNNNGAFSETDFDLSTNIDLSLECWFELAGTAAGAKTLIAVGGNTVSNVQLNAWISASSGTLNLAFSGRDASATAWNTGALDTLVEVDTDQLIHLVVAHDRGTDVDVYVNGTLALNVLNAAFTTPDTAGDVDLTTATANDRVGIFTTLGNAHSQPGKFYSFKWWKAAVLGASDVAILNQYGPGQYPTLTAGDAGLVIDAVTDRANWVDPLYPEFIAGTPASRTVDRTFDVNDHGAAEVITGNAIASLPNRKRIKANSQGAITIPSGINYLSIYTKPAATGTIELAKL